MEVAEQWIEKGYSMTKVLEILEIHRSTYYDQQNGKVEKKTVGEGRPTPSYSLTATSAKVPDEQTKEWLSKLVMGKDLPTDIESGRSSWEEPIILSSVKRKCIDGVKR